MAGVVKWLRPRIVVPIFVGSNPISRPIFNIWEKRLLKEVFFCCWIRTINLLRKFWVLSSREMILNHFSRQSHLPPHKKANDFMLLAFLLCVIFGIWEPNRPIGLFGFERIFCRVRRIFLCSMRKHTKRKSVDTFNAKNPRQSHLPYFYLEDSNHKFTS